MNSIYSEIVQNFRNKVAQKDLADSSASVMKLVEAREECADVTRALESQKEVLYLFTYLKYTF